MEIKPTLPYLRWRSGLLLRDMLDIPYGILGNEKFQEGYFKNTNPLYTLEYYITHQRVGVGFVDMYRHWWDLMMKR